MFTTARGPTTGLHQATGRSACAGDITGLREHVEPPVPGLLPASASKDASGDQFAVTA